MRRRTVWALLLAVSICFAVPAAVAADQPRYAAAEAKNRGADDFRAKLATWLESHDSKDEGFNRLASQYADIALPILQDALKSSDQTRQRNALRLLKSVAPYGGDTVPLLLPFLDYEDHTIFANSAASLGLYGDAAHVAVPRLLKLLDTYKVARRQAAAEALRRIGIAADQIPNLWPGVLKIEDSNNNYDSFYRLGQAAASPGRKAMPELIRGLSDADPRVRRAAAYACAYLGPVAGEAALPLLKLQSSIGKRMSTEEREAASGAMWALDKLGSTAAPAIDGLAGLLEQSSWENHIVPVVAISAPGARELAHIGPVALPALYRALASPKDTVQAGAASALGQMDAEEAKPAIPRLLKLFDESKQENVRIVALQALLAIGADRKDLEPRLRPLVGRSNSRDGKGVRNSLSTIADMYFKNHEKKGPPDSYPPLSNRLGGVEPYHFDPADFSWGEPSKSIQIGATLPPLISSFQEQYPDIERVVLAIRNVGNTPVVLPINGTNADGVEETIAESPGACRSSGWGPTDLRELRPGQVLIRSPLFARRLAIGVGYQLEFNRKDAAGRWMPFVPEDKEYHVTVTLHGLGTPPPPQTPCYLSKAIRNECWQGEAKSGAIKARLDSAVQRENKRIDSKSISK